MLFNYSITVTLISLFSKAVLQVNQEFLIVRNTSDEFFGWVCVAQSSKSVCFVMIDGFCNVYCLFLWRSLFNKIYGFLLQIKAFSEVNFWLNLVL